MWVCFHYRVWSYIKRGELMSKTAREITHDCDASREVPQNMNCGALEHDCGASEHELWHRGASEHDCGASEHDYMAEYGYQLLV